MNEIITNNEVNNDGKSIHLYFNGLLGLYTVYGSSAYALSKKTNVKVAYSESMQMPVVVINQEHLDELVKNLKVEKQKNGYYCLVNEAGIDENEYIEWVSKVSMGGEYRYLYDL